MFATALIVFREVLEAALIVSIVMAASLGVAGRGRWVSIGVGAGVIGALLVAAFASVISDAAAGMGQEVFNAGILALAVLMLGWHSIWMARHGRELAKDLGAVGKAVSSGNRPLYALALAVGSAVLREGSETVLFLHGIAAGEDNASQALIAGGGIGLLGGVAAGVGMYLGLLKIPVRYLFSVTNWMVLLLAAGMASQAAGFLVQAGLIPDLGSPIWDTSWLLNEKSMVGKVMHALVGYVSRPAGVQVLMFLVTLATITTLMRLIGNPSPAARHGRLATALVAAVALAVTAYMAVDSHAGVVAAVLAN
jgi:high-affinity iron transporter